MKSLQNLSNVHIYQHVGMVNAPAGGAGRRSPVLPPGKVLLACRLGFAEVITRRTAGHISKTSPDMTDKSANNRGPQLLHQLSEFEAAPCAGAVRKWLIKELILTGACGLAGPPSDPKITSRLPT